MHSPSREREIFKFLIGLSLCTVFGLFNNCSGTKDLQAQSESHIQSGSQVEMSSETLVDPAANQNPE